MTWVGITGIAQRSALGRSSAQRGLVGPSKRCDALPRDSLGDRLRRRAAFAPWRRCSSATMRMHRGFPRALPRGKIGSVTVVPTHVITV